MPAVDTRPQYKVWPSLRPNPKEEGLVCALDLGSPVNGICPDLSGNGNNGTVNGGCVEQTPLGKGMKFYALDQYILLPANANCGLTNNYNTVEAWFEPIALGANNYTEIYSNGIGATFTSIMARQAASQIRVTLNGNSYNFVATYSLLSLNHVVVTIDHVNDSVAVYFNGVPVAPQAFVNYAPAIGTPRLYSNLASGNPNDYARAIGVTTKIYNRLLTEAEMRAHYLQGKSALWRAGYGVAVDSSDRGGTLGECI